MPSIDSEIRSFFRAIAQIAASAHNHPVTIQLNSSRWDESTYRGEIGLYTSLARLLSLTYDKFMRSRLHSCLGILEKTQWMKKGELQRLQVRKLKILLKHAYENVPYYHGTFKKNRFRPIDFSELRDLQKIPVLQRSSMHSKSEELLARNENKTDLISCRTNGTTATPVKFYRSKMDMTWGTASLIRGHGWAGYKTGAKLAYIRRVRPNDELARIDHRIRRFVNRSKLLNVHDLSEESMASFSRRLCGFEPDYVEGIAGPTNIYAVFLLENPRFRIRPKAVLTYGQTLLPHYRKNIERAFDCKVYDYYGSSEMSHVAAQCGQHEGHHINEENVLVEIEKDGEIAGPGEEGKVLLTNLNSFAMPFIRYDIGDSGKKLNDDCPCGRELSLFTPIGRVYEYFAHSNGTFTTFRDLQTFFEGLPIQNFQIVQESYDEIVIRIVRRTGYTQAHTNFILSNISFRIAKIANVRVELVDSLPFIGIGKVPHFLSKIPTEYT